MRTETTELIGELRKLPDTLLMSKYSWGASIILEASDRLEELNKYEHSLTDDLHAAYDTIRGLEFELEKAKMSDKSDTKSAERLINKTGLRVAMYAGRLNERIEELEKENAALLKRLESKDGWDDYNSIKTLQRENAALRADKERFDWLERNGNLLRLTIDAARKEQP